MKKYNISLVQLENKVYSFEIEDNADFFLHFAMGDVQDGSFNAKVDVGKSETMVNLHFEIKGSLKLICDRSLEEFDYNFEIADAIILKFGDRDEDLADGIKIINRNTQQINVAQDIYELISISIPMKKLHPKFNEDDFGDAEGLIVYSTDKPEIEKIEELDPRWAVLKTLK